MLKAVFIDYTGTMVREDEPYTRELVRYFASHSELKDPNEILRVVWTKIKEIEAESYGDSFRKNDEKVDFILEYCSREHGLRGDFSYIHEVWHKVWTYAPLYDDVKPFFERTKLPVYVLSNDDLCFLEESMRVKDLHPAEIAEMCGFSESHFLRLFRQYTNMPFKKYVNNCRITSARYMLASNARASVTDVCLQCGFSSISTFNRLFKENVGHSPTEFRRLQRSYEWGHEE